MKRIVFVSMVATLTSIAISLQAQPQTSAPLPQSRHAPSQRAEVAFPDRTVVQAEVAATEAEREHGLMSRSSLGDLDGMIFVFGEPGLHAFWMKDTLIPLDMIWLDSGGRVVSLAESVPPCKTPTCPTYPPRAPASYVLEVNAGFAKKHEVRVGDTLAVSGLDLKKPLPQ
jgi:uncharacterized membrane protein (UPF0127 family)